MTNGKGRYDGALNKASITPAQSRAALLQSKNGVLNGPRTAAWNPADPTGLAGITSPVIGGATPVSIQDVSPSAAKEQADALKGQVNKAADGLTNTGSPENAPSDSSGVLTQILGKLDTIITALGEGGTLGLVKTAVNSIDLKMGAGLTAELASFLNALSIMLTSVVTTPIVTAIQTANFMSGIGQASNVTKAAYGGYISGPGGPTADKVPAWLSNGEYVIKSKAVQALGLPRLHALNNADKALPQFGFGGFIGDIFKNIGKFFKTDNGKLILSTVAPMLLTELLPKGAKPYAGLISAGLLGSLSAFTNGKTKSKSDVEEFYKNPTKFKGFTDLRGNIPSNYAATGGLLLNGRIRKFGGGGSAGGAGGGSAAGNAAKAGGIAAALAIGMALIGRWKAGKQRKKELEDYKKNRVKDPYGMNPDSLTFYKNPIITGSRNWLASGGPITSDMMLKTMPSMGGGMKETDLDEIIKNAGGGDSPINLNQNINITTPDVHSFRNSRGQMERDLARVTQRGLKRRAPKY